MAPHSSTLAWKIPWMEEPGRLQSMGSLGVGQNWATSLSLFTFMHWRRKWQPTPVFLPGESQGRGSLMGWRLWGCTESDTTEWLTLLGQPICVGWMFQGSTWWVSRISWILSWKFFSAAIPASNSQSSSSFSVSHGLSLEAHLHLKLLPVLLG